MQDLCYIAPLVKYTFGGWDKGSSIHIITQPFTEGRIQGTPADSFQGRVFCEQMLVTIVNKLFLSNVHHRGRQPSWQLVFRSFPSGPQT